MNHNAYNMFRLRALFWFAVIFAIGQLRAASGTATLHNSSTQTLRGIQAGYTGGGYETLHLVGTPRDLAPGESMTQYISWDSSPAGSDYIDGKFVFAYSPAEIVGNSYVSIGGVYYYVVSTFSLAEGYETDNTFYGDAIPPAATADADKTLWIVTDSDLTADVFREGIDKVVAASSQKSSSGGTPVTLTGTDTEYVATAARHALEHPEDVSGALTSGLETLGVTAKLDAAKTEYIATVPTAPSTLGYDPNSSAGSGDFLSIAMPAEFGGATVNFNPFADTNMYNIAQWFRYATQWLAYLLLGRFVFEQIALNTRSMSTANQADGKPLISGTGAQASAVFNAIILTSAFVIGVVALLAWTFESISITSLISNLGTNPLLGMSENVYWFLNQFLPIATLITCAVARASWHLYANIAMGVYYTVARWAVA